MYPPIAINGIDINDNKPICHRQHSTIINPPVTVVKLIIKNGTQIDNTPLTALTSNAYLDAICPPSFYGF